MKAFTWLLGTNVTASINYCDEVYFYDATLGSAVTARRAQLTHASWLVWPVRTYPREPGPPRAPLANHGDGDKRCTLSMHGERSCQVRSRLYVSRALFPLSHSFSSK
jgi:hypothetical protein